MLLRQTHPKPRLTIPLADQKLTEQVEEMQMLMEKVQAVKQKGKAEKTRLKTGATEVENLRIEAAEAQITVKSTQMEEEDSRLVPLYDWYVHSGPPCSILMSLCRFSGSLALHRSISSLEDSHSESENELRLTYKLDMPPPTPSHRIIITLIFEPDTKRLATAEMTGLEELGVDVGDVVDAHVQVNDVHGLVAAILASARAAVST